MNILAFLLTTRQLLLKFDNEINAKYSLKLKAVNLLNKFMLVLDSAPPGALSINV